MVSVRGNDREVLRRLHDAGLIEGSLVSWVDLHAHDTRQLFSLKNFTNHLIDYAGQKFYLPPNQHQPIPVAEFFIDFSYDHAEYSAISMITTVRPLSEKELGFKPPEPPVKKQQVKNAHVVNGQAKDIQGLADLLSGPKVLRQPVRHDDERLYKQKYGSLGLVDLVGISKATGNPDDFNPYILGFTARSTNDFIEFYPFSTKNGFAKVLSESLSFQGLDFLSARSLPAFSKNTMKRALMPLLHEFIGVHFDVKHRRKFTNMQFHDYQTMAYELVKKQSLPVQARSVPYQELFSSLYTNDEVLFSYLPVSLSSRFVTDHPENTSPAVYGAPVLLSNYDPLSDSFGLFNFGYFFGFDRDDWLGLASDEILGAEFTFWKDKAFALKVSADIVQEFNVSLSTVYRSTKHGPVKFLPPEESYKNI